MVPLGNLWALGPTSRLTAMRAVLPFSTMRGFQWIQFDSCKLYRLSL